MVSLGLFRRWLCFSNTIIAYSFHRQRKFNLKEGGPGFPTRRVSSPKGQLSIGLPSLSFRAVKEQ